jgi:predicted esterase YcpF (UPF0227 family)
MFYYIHGYLSSPDGTKAILFKEKLNCSPIKYRDVEPENLVISDCLKQIELKIKDVENVTLIGSSLGGFLAAKTAFYNSNVKKMILLNPAIIPPNYDISKITDMPQSIAKDMQDENLLTNNLSTDVLVIIGTNDQVVSNKWGVDYAKSQEATVKFVHDDHQLSKTLNKLPEIISKFINQKN